MVSGMMKPFGSTFVVILVLALLLFHSMRWAILAVLPLTVTILLLYGGVGFIGRDYDMPLAVLSTLALGIAVDFAIHFVQRYRELLRETRAPERIHHCRRFHPGVLNLSRALHRGGRPYGDHHYL